MERVTVGIIGAGRIGRLHAANVLRSDRLYLKAISDIQLDHLRETHFEEQVPIITTETEQLIADSEIDAVLICSLTDTHTDFIKAFARAGKHIFCEKPVSFNIEETREALQVVNEMGVKFQVGFNRRFDKHFHRVFETVAGGKIGKPHIIKVSSRDPEPPPESYIKRSGGMFMDMTIHDFDMIRYLSNSEVSEISVKAANLVNPMFSRNDDVDTAITTLKLENGTIAVIDNSRQAVYG